MVCAPGTALTVPPAQVVSALGFGATIMPSVALPGSGSVIDTSTIGELFVFCRTIRNVDIPPGLTEGGVKDLLMEISLGTLTVRSAVTLFEIVRFSLLVMSLGAMTLVCTPPVLLVT